MFTKTKNIIVAIALVICMTCIAGCSQGNTSYIPVGIEYPARLEDMQPISIEALDDMYDFESLPHHCTYAAVYDLKAGELLYASNNLSDKIYPASTTKLLTALTALDYVDADEIFTVGDEVSLIGDGSSIAYIKKGHRLTAEMLIQAMMIPSGNDAAYALAAGVGRKISGENISSTEAVSLFVEKMNDKAQKLGLYNTHFTSPDGYHDDEHYTTLSDMLGMSITACNNETIIKYCKMKSAYAVYASGESITWQNTNKLLDPDSPYYYEGVCGLKTGSTEEAGCCLITLFDDGEQRLLVLTFDSPDNEKRYSDVTLLLNEFVN
jgi:D-alanyl-D-alanine carboxypeptidase (penicillin-binding protein 5/6)